MAAFKTLPDIDLMRQLVTYDPATGEMRWLERPRWMFTNDRTWESTNKRWAGSRAFTCKKPNGFVGRINHSLLYAHRVAYTLHHGVPPQGEIDHINGNPYDNRACNLRDVTKEENQRNRARLRRETSRPHFGVSPTSNKWTASIYRDGKPLHLGSYKTAEEAIAARKGAELALGYHPNHGRAPRQDTGNAP